jgi:hypothetical protein
LISNKNNLYPFEKNKGIFTFLKIYSYFLLILENIGLLFANKPIFHSSSNGEVIPKFKALKDKSVLFVLSISALTFGFTIF